MAVAERSPFVVLAGSGSSPKGTGADGGGADGLVAQRRQVAGRYRAVRELIASPFLDDYLVLRPGSMRGLRIPHSRYLELRHAADSGDLSPDWLVDAVRQQWELDLAGRTVGGSVLVRERSPYGYGRASYELNLGCNYDCEHCYLGLKRFRGLPWPDRERLLHAASAGSPTRSCFARTPARAAA
jgi:hypothetical protein